MVFKGTKDFMEKLWVALFLIIIVGLINSVAALSAFTGFVPINFLGIGSLGNVLVHTVGLSLAMMVAAAVTKRRR